MTEDSLGPLLDRLERTVLRFGDERGDRPAIDFGEGATGELTWGDLRRLNRLLRWAGRADQGVIVRRLEAEDREHRRWRRVLASLDADDPMSPDFELGADGDDLADP